MATCLTRGAASFSISSCLTAVFGGKGGAGDVSTRTCQTSYEPGADRVTNTRHYNRSSRCCLTCGVSGIRSECNDDVDALADEIINERPEPWDRAVASRSYNS